MSRLFDKPWKVYVGRFFLVVVPLEIILHFVRVPPSLEAGIWHGNTYSDRLIIEVNSWMGKSFYNKDGYRDREWRRDAQQPRIAVLGDSRFYGQYVDREETFSARITEKGNMEALNFGLPGASIYEAQDFILDDALAFRPQAAVLCYDINSSLFSYMTRAESGSRHDIFINLFRSSALFRWLELGFIFLRSEQKPVMSLKSYDEMLSNAIDKMRDQGVKTIIFFIGWTPMKDFPGLYTKERYDLFRQATRTIAKREKIPIIEMEAMLKGKSKEDYLIGMEQIHFSPLGHELMSQKILLHLEP